MLYDAVDDTPTRVSPTASVLVLSLMVSVRVASTHPTTSPAAAEL